MTVRDRWLLWLTSYLSLNLLEGSQPGATQDGVSCLFASCSLGWLLVLSVNLLSLYILNAHEFSFWFSVHNLFQLSSCLSCTVWHSCRMVNKLEEAAVGQGSPWLASLSLRGPFPQVLTLLGGVRFIAWRLRCSFWGECWWGPRHFWSSWLRLGHGPAPTLKKALCCACPDGRMEDKYSLVYTGGISCLEIHN